MTENRRDIQSFVRRQGRLTTGQKRAIEYHWHRFGLVCTTTPLNLDQAFNRSASERILEIGFGNGEALLTQAVLRPDVDFLGIEVHQPGVGHLLMRLVERELTNVRVICDDAVRVLRECLADAGFNRINIYFPDPWPKKRHHKRRLIQPAFVALLARKLRPGGLLHLATDWEPYAEQMLGVLESSPDFVNLAADYAPRPPERPLTRFEQRGQRLGHMVRDLLFRRLDNDNGSV
jgi:tRNA (guanine-N7-)-methyltransferase